MKRAVLAAWIILTAWLPLIVAGVLLGLLFGRRIPVAITLAYALLIARWQMRLRLRTRLGAGAEFVVFAIVGGVLGAFALGGLGAIFGVAVGFMARLAEVPITGIHPWGRRDSGPKP